MKKIIEKEIVVDELKEEVVEKTSVSIISSNGGHIRTYSKEVHGKDFEALAKEFSSHTHGSVLKDEV